MGRHDVSNPASATPASLFPNDFSSSNAREKPAREKALTETERQVDELEHQLAQFRQDYDFMKFRLDQTNPAGNLDHSYQSRRVQIKLACWPHSALDLHGPHGWDSDPSSLSQILCLRRVNTRDNCCAWAISPHNDIECYLGVSETEPRKVEIQRGRRSDDQHWFIGLNSQKTGYRCVFLK